MVDRHLLFAALVASRGIFALPMNGQLIEGHGRFQSVSPQVLEIVTEDLSIIHWEQFHVEEKETVRFQLPNCNSAVLNRVVGSGEMSHILGQIQSNGKILLINPLGILFGNTARIDVGSLYASTLDLHDELFLSGKDWKFEGDSLASLENEGEILSSGDLFLAAHSVVNKGKLQGQEVGLIACSELGIKMKGAERLFFRRGDSSTHAGTVTAFGGKVYLFGSHIALNENATVDVSHPFCAGQILIGGEKQGHNRQNTPVADSIFVSSNAILSANSLESGPGGKIILFSDQWNQCYGTITARGGASGGDGGFVEFSAPTLDFFNFPDLSSPFGKGGEFLIDPTDVLISAAVSSSFVTIGNPTTWTAASVPVQPLNIRSSGAGSLSNFLQNTGSVTINTSLLPDRGVNGNITVTGAVTWTSNNSLVLNSAGNMLFNASVQNTGAGNVILIAPDNRSITLATIVAGASVNVGSQNGTTSIGDLTIANRCLRSRPDVSINSHFNNSNVRLGFNNVGGGQSQGPIEVVCRNLDILFEDAGANTIGVAAIGHGAQAQVNGFTTTNQATITVDASGAIHLQSHDEGGAVNMAVIGHGDRVGMAMATALRGDICVAAVGDILLDTSRVGSGILATRIGHGVIAFGGAASVSEETGDITVTSSNGSITLATYNQADVSIGHVTSLVTPSPGLVTGDIVVAARNNLTMTNTAIAGTPQSCGIGHYNNSAPNQFLPNLNSNITVVVGGDITIDTLGVGSFMGIGHQAVILVGNVNVSAGGNITLTNTESTYITNIGYRMMAGNGNSNTAVTAGGNISFNPVPSANNSVQIRGSGNLVSVAAQGNISGTGSTSIFGTSFISTLNNTTAATTQIFAGGTITSTDFAGIHFFLGQTNLGTITPWDANIDIASGGTITIPYNMTTQNGNLTLATPVQFIDGELFGATTVNACTGCPVDIVLAQSLANIPVNGAAVNLPSTNITTSGGNVVLTSFIDAFCPEAVADLSIGAIPANDLSISTTTGSITLTNFNDISINQALTTGSAVVDAIFISACHDVNVSGAITETGLGSIQILAQNDVNVNQPIQSNAGDITINADVSDVGTGDLNLTANITSTNGNIFLEAGTEFNCNSNNRTNSIVQTAGTISTTTGNITANASNVITLSSPVSMTAPAGSIFTQAGRNTILMNTALSAGGAEILMISGTDMNMIGSTITAPLSRVTLVVDNCFPTMPLIGPGAFRMDTTSVILGDPRIFTALQNLNVILGIINGVNYTRGTLFEDTIFEQWCQYFAFPFPYPFPNLGEPYTIFYKNCFQQATYEANVIESQFFIDLHPFNEFPGWASRFLVSWHDRNSNTEMTRPYWLRRRNLNIVNHPKSWTLIAY
jgi:filamentous hemagglutinin family protein